MEAIETHKNREGRCTALSAKVLDKNFQMISFLAAGSIVLDSTSEFCRTLGELPSIGMLVCSLILLPILLCNG